MSSSNKKSPISATDIYDFCMDWHATPSELRDELIKKFHKENWDFNYFRNIAKLCKWYVISMEVLNQSFNTGGWDHDYDDLNEEDEITQVYVTPSPAPSTQVPSININTCRCSRCKAKLNPGETPCWSCGLENPTL